MASQPNDPFASLDAHKEFRERSRHINEQVEHFAQPWRSEALESQKAAIAFAQNVIKSGQLLNGGGLLAIPALATLFSLDAHAGQSLLVFTAIAFGSGLLFAWICNFCGYFSNGYRSQAFSVWARAQEDNVRIYPGEAERSAERVADYKKEIGEGEKLFKRSEIFAVMGFAHAFLSLVCFLFGAYLGHRALTETPKRVTAINSSVVAAPSILPRPPRADGH
jgi:hypothetical protein